MTERRIAFEHDGHRFEAVEHEDPPGPPRRAEAVVHWEVSMDGAPALEFSGEFPYRDPDVRKRVVEWYETQKPR